MTNQDMISKLNNILDDLAEIKSQLSDDNEEELVDMLNLADMQINEVIEELQ